MSATLTNTDLTFPQDNVIKAGKDISIGKLTLPKNSKGDGMNFLVSNGADNSNDNTYWIPSRQERVRNVLLSTVTGNILTNVNWESICWSPSLGIFIMVNSSNASYGRSSDGINWTYSNFPENSSWSGIEWSPELGIFCVVGRSGVNRCLTSPDGVNWTARTVNAEAWLRIVWSPELGIFCATSFITTACMTSPDGINWTYGDISPATSIFGLVWAPELKIFCGVCSGGVSVSATSPDGLNWTIGDAASNLYYGGITWMPDKKLFATTQFSADKSLIVSSDGLTWNSVSTIPKSNNNNRIIYILELGALVVLASPNAPGPTISWTSDLTTWNQVNSTCTAILTGACWSPQLGLLVGVGQNGSNTRLSFYTLP